MTSVHPRVQSPKPTPEQTATLDDFQKALEKIDESTKLAREVEAKARAEVVRKKSIPQMRIPAELRKPIVGSEALEQSAPAPHQQPSRR